MPQTLRAPSLIRTTGSKTAPLPVDPIRFGCGGGVYRIVGTPATSAGHHFAIEATEPPGGGPPLHIHRNEEEFFFVLDGEVSFAVGDRVVRARAGETAFVPRGVPHCFKNCSDRPAKL